MLQDIVLGIVQGLTEFLPVSSSGHLVVVPAMFGWEQPSLTFNLVLHLGTLVAVIAVYRRDLWQLALSIVNRGHNPVVARRLLLLLAIGTVPAGIAGIAFGSFFEERFERPLATCVQLVATACILIAAEWFAARPREKPRDIGPSVAGWVGVAQAAAILPGISRSGATIATGLGLGADRAGTARFSFLLSIPAIFGAVLTQIPDVAGGDFEITASVVAGFFAALVSGYLAIEGFLRFLRTHSLRAFAYYLLVFAPVAAVVIELR